MNDTRIANSNHILQKGDGIQALGNSFVSKTEQFSIA